ncbi:MAG: hypothetical protein D6721_04350, partial [Gammaproteobacteria bacterium]
LVGIDQLANAVIGGDPDETISSRIGKRRGRCKLCAALCWLLDKIDPRHCARSIEADEGRRELF